MKRASPGASPSLSTGEGEAVRKNLRRGGQGAEGDSLEALFVASMQSLCSSPTSPLIDWPQLRRACSLQPSNAKDWVGIEHAALALRQAFLFPAAQSAGNTDAKATQTGAVGAGASPSLLDHPEFVRVFDRALQAGGWAAAARDAEGRGGCGGWAVLGAGVNGIRKTSTLAQGWFQKALAGALQGSRHPAEGQLPEGKTTFYRALDYLIVAVGNAALRRLYVSLPPAQGGREEEGTLALYTAGKAAIFAKFRALAEMAGALLLQKARKRGMHVWVETSGRDKASLAYMNHFFPSPTCLTSPSHTKLLLRFSVSSLRYAKESVDKRMLAEIQAARQAVLHHKTPPPLMGAGSGAEGEGGRERRRNLVAVAVAGVNQGGPYGSDVLEGVQAQEQRVWAGITGTGKQKPPGKAADKGKQQGQQAGDPDLREATRGWKLVHFEVLASAQPEQWRLKPAGCSDVFSFGRLLAMNVERPD